MEQIIRIKSHVYKLFVLYAILSPFQLNAQIPNGSWRDHLSYIKGKEIAITPTKVFCAAEMSGMLSYNKTTREIEKYSTVNGLSEIQISTLFYSEQTENLIICYNSGSIDLLSKNKAVINIPDIKNKSLISSKRINKIEPYGNNVYLACDFGIVVLDLEKIEIKESYFFGEGGDFIKVNDIAISGNTIFAATESGIYKASINDENLLDYSNWKHIADVPQNNSEYKFIEFFADRVFAVYHNTNSNRDQIIQYFQDQWLNFEYSLDTTIQNIDVYQNLLSISGYSNTSFYNQDLVNSYSFSIPNGRHAIRDSDGTFYFAATGLGLMKSDESGNISYLGVNSPRFNTVGQVFAYQNQVWVASGGPFNEYHEGGAYNFSNNTWSSLNIGWTEGLEGLGNFYKIAFKPSDPQHIFASGYLFGLYEIQYSAVLKSYAVVKSYTYDNTELFRSTIDPNVNVRIMGLDFDSKGNLWMICDETDQPVYVLRANGELEHLSINLVPTKFRDLEVTESDQIWIMSRSSGLIVLKEEDDGSITSKAFDIKNQQDDLIGMSYCLTEDKNGDIWVGTNKGPVLYRADNDIFSRSEVSGSQVSIARNDGTEYADYLLDYVIITDIAIDGGDRKWIATESSGIYLVSDDGQKTLHHFTAENSPLFSNNVIGLGVQQNTGEVFISTNYGVISFMGTSTEGLTDFTDVYVYPNPVRPEYEGDITITGLIENSNVKVTDISGNLVFETTSEGGKAVWDSKNFDGDKVHTGVYLVFLSNEDGTKTYITKLLFIH